jgi:glycosyltransferase involved in cell wall biosynthesis
MNENKLNKIPLVSVIITCYNREKEIQRAIKSVRWQTYINIEIIIVDDASIDESVKMINELNDPGLNLIVHDYNQGQNAALRSGLTKCRGNYVAFLDSDNIWLPEYLERMIESFNEDIEMTYCWMVGGSRSFLSYTNSYADVLAQGFLSNLNTMVVRRRVLNSLECFPDLVGHLRVCQDDILCFAIVCKHKFKLIPMQLAVSLPAENSMTNLSTDLPDGMEIFLNEQKKEIIEYGGYSAYASRKLSLASSFFLARKRMRGTLYLISGAILMIIVSLKFKKSKNERTNINNLSIILINIITSLLRSFRKRQ